MKKFICLIPSMLLMASCGSQHQSKGVLIDATMNTVAVLTQDNDTMSFSTVNAEKQFADGLLLGDTVDVTYSGRYHAGMSAERIATRPQLKANAESTDDDNGLGKMEHNTYCGNLPSASGSGILYRLTINSRQYSGDGTFNLSLTYKGADNGKDKTFEYSGKRFTQRGIPGDDNATVWQCVSGDARYIFNFLRVNDSTLLLLNSKFEKPESQLNYQLKLTCDNGHGIL